MASDNPGCDVDQLISSLRKLSNSRADLEQSQLLANPWKENPVQSKLLQSFKRVATAQISPKANLQPPTSPREIISEETRRSLSAKSSRAAKSSVASSQFPFPDRDDNGFCGTSKPSGKKKGVTKQIREIGTEGEESMTFASNACGIVDLIELKLQTSMYYEQRRLMKRKADPKVKLPQGLQKLTLRAYYCTPFGRVEGTLSLETVNLASLITSPQVYIDPKMKKKTQATLKETKRPQKEPKIVLFFQPTLGCESNYAVYQSMGGSSQHFKVAIDFKDVTSVSRLRSICSDNEVTMLGQSKDIRTDEEGRDGSECSDAMSFKSNKPQVFSYYMGLSLTCVDGDYIEERLQPSEFVVCRDPEIVQKESEPACKDPCLRAMSTAYFQFPDRTTDGNFYSNEEQADLLNQTVKSFRALLCKLRSKGWARKHYQTELEKSATFLNFYDLISPEFQDSSVKLGGPIEDSERIIEGDETISGDISGRFGGNPCSKGLGFCVYQDYMDLECSSDQGEEQRPNFNIQESDVDQSLPEVVIDDEKADDEEEKQLEDELDAAALSKVRGNSIFHLYDGPQVNFNPVNSEDMGSILSSSGSTAKFKHLQVESQKGTSLFSQNLSAYAEGEKAKKEDFENEPMGGLSVCIPNFIPVPEQFSSSNILPAFGFYLIQLYLPSVIRMREWKLVFSIDNDGTSMDTFYKKVTDYYEQDYGTTETVLIVEDDRGQVFGAFISEAWKNSSQFYGDGSTFIFKFKTGASKPRKLPFQEKIKQAYLPTDHFADTGSSSSAQVKAEQSRVISDVSIFHTSGANSKFQHSNSTSLSVGGSDLSATAGSSKTGSALYISNYFKTGMAYANCQTFNNHPGLSHSDYFKVVKFEVWGFNDL